MHAATNDSVGPSNDSSLIAVASAIFYCAASLGAGRRHSCASRAAVITKITRGYGETLARLCRLRGNTSVNSIKLDANRPMPKRKGHAEACPFAEFDKVEA